MPRERFSFGCDYAALMLPRPMLASYAELRYGHAISPPPFDIFAAAFRHDAIGYAGAAVADVSLLHADAITLLCRFDRLHAAVAIDYPLLPLLFFACRFRH